MRGLNLKIDLLSRLLEQNVFKQEVDIFCMSGEEYKQMYEEQGIEYWTKYIISCREILIKEFSINVDNIFIQFLTAINHKYEAINSFIVSYNEQYTEYKSSIGSKSSKYNDLKIKEINCAVKISAGFIRMYKLWKISPVVNNIQWELPEYCLQKIGPFEKCLASFNTIKQLEEMFQSSMNRNITIYWLETLKCELNCKKEKKKTSLKCKIPLGVFKNVRDLPKTGSLALATTSSQVLVEEEESVDYITNYKTTTIQWLISSKSAPKTSKNFQYVKGVFQILRDSSNLSSHFWNLFEISLSPILVPKYHAMKIQALIKTGTDHHYMDVTAWVTWVNNTFGLDLLTHVNLYALQLMKPGGVKLDEEKTWKKNINNVIKLVSSVRDMKSAPNSEDNAKKALEFLREPTVVIQLPFNLLLLHQWLVAAYVEVLLFEKNSMELRIWPLPPNLMDPAIKILTMVRKLKEKVILGFGILFQLALTRNKEKPYEKWIMDEVVLPSLETLQFLIAGKAYNILKSIKKLAWSEPQDFQEDWLFIADHVFTVSDPELRKYSTSFPYSEMFWDSVDPIFYYLQDTGHDLNIENIITNLHTEPEKYPYEYDYENNKSLSINSKGLLARFDVERREHTFTNRELLNIGISTIKEVVGDAKRAPNVDMDSLARDLIDDFDWIRKPCLEIKLAILLRRRQASLVGSEEEESATARIIRLGLEVSERELLITLAFYINRADSQNPVAIHLAKVTPMEISSMMKLLEDVVKNEKDKQWLWTQFPEEWKKPVNSNEDELDVKSGIELIVKKCEERIGRLVLNTIEKCYEKSDGNIFPHLQIVQYVLPSIVAAFIQDSHIPISGGESTSRLPFGAQHTSFQNLAKPLSAINSMTLKLINELLKSYELKYQKWISNTKDSDLLTDGIRLNDLYEIKSCINYYKEIFNTYTYAFIKSELENSYCNEILNTIIENNEINLSSYYFLRTWNVITYNFIKNLYDISIKCWEIPLPETEICVPNFSEIYMEEAIVHVLEHAIHATAINDKSVQASLVQLDPNRGNDEWRCKFLDHITNDEEDGTEVGTLTLSKRISLTCSYEVIKEYIKSVGKVDIKYIHLYPLQPSKIQIALKLCQKGDIKSLDSMLPLLVNPSQPLYPGLEYIYKGEVVKGDLTSENENSGVAKCCNNCQSQERKRGSFRVCLKCIAERFPNVHYYCSKRCEEVYWNKIHKSQHLDHILGIPSASM